ncbi:MAG TPA: hypothetical protein PKM73_14440 [Verrucomicrobiota bacterium]|nr:hypothetical protein [Verrucomicrobiota bacterium]
MIQFNDVDLERREIAPRTSHLSASLTAKRDLERYYLALQQQLPALTESEAMAICDVCNSWAAWDSPKSPAYLWAELEDALTEGLTEKWGITQAFVERIKAMSYIERVALVDAAERFWASPDHSHETLKTVFRLV